MSDNKSTLQSMHLIPSPRQLRYLWLQVTTLHPITQSYEVEDLSFNREGLFNFMTDTILQEMDKEHQGVSQPRYHYSTMHMKV